MLGHHRYVAKLHEAFMLVWVAPETKKGCYRVLSTIGVEYSCKFAQGRINGTPAHGWIGSRLDAFQVFECASDLIWCRSRFASGCWQKRRTEMQRLSQI